MVALLSHSDWVLAAKSSMWCLAEFSVFLHITGLAVSSWHTNEAGQQWHLGFEEQCWVVESNKCRILKWNIVPGNSSTFETATETWFHLINSIVRFSFPVSGMVGRMQDTLLKRNFRTPSVLQKFLQKLHRYKEARAIKICKKMQQIVAFVLNYPELQKSLLRWEFS